jgi:NAD(P)-dependent dehydrogenase (short-subunit alcohol dehydrogenase family)
MDDANNVVIVTGSSGYIGSSLIHRFAKRYRLVGFDRENPPHPPPVAECVCIDLTSDSSVEAALRRVRTAYGERIASVIHLAAYFDLTGEPKPQVRRDHCPRHRAPSACAAIVRGRAIRLCQHDAGICPWEARAADQ